MARRNGSAVLRGTASLLAAAIALCIAPAQASATGLFESIFGDAIDDSPPQTPAYAEPTIAPPIVPQRRTFRRAPAGPRHAFCVRTCDGRYFPVQPHSGLSAAEACRSFCPACKTRLYYGTAIDHARARDGSRYADLPNAYLYRKHMVANCQCNEHSAVGLAKITPKSDPTLHRGDVVATGNGLVVYSGVQGKTANFTPVQSYPGFSRNEREHLSALRVTPPDRRGTAETPVILSPTATRGLGSHHTAQR